MNVPCQPEETVSALWYVATIVWASVLFLGAMWLITPRKESQP